MYRVTKTFKILDSIELMRALDPGFDYYAVVLYILKDSSNIVSNADTTLAGNIETAKVRECVDNVRREYLNLGKYLNVTSSFDPNTNTLTVEQDFDSEASWLSYSAKVNELFNIDISGNFAISGKLESTVQFSTI